MRRALGVFLVALVLALPATAEGAVRIVRIAGGFSSPVQVDAPRGIRGLFVVEQPGRITYYRNGTRKTVLDIRDRVRFVGGEEGLLSMAFSPRYRTHPSVYVYFTDNNGNNVVERYTADSTLTRLRESTRKVLIRISHPTYANHNGGTLRFGPDGELYLSTGDGGGSCDPNERAQNLSSPLGKFLQVHGTSWEIFGYGLRNPWRFSFGRASGDLYIGDVGQSSREEINYLPRASLGGAAENFLWDKYEGSLTDTCENDGLKGTGPQVLPIHEYNRASGFTVIGGFEYGGRNMTAQVGRYFYGDLNGSVRSFVVSGGSDTGHRTEGFTVESLASFGEDAYGELYAVSLGGTIYRLVE
jgi:hypothetical protein